MTDAAYGWLMTVDESDVQAALPPDMREMAELIGLDAALRLIERFQGQQIYIPKLDGPAFKRLRHERIIEEFTGANQNELARRYNLSRRQIDAIIAASRAPKYQQTSMFG